MPREPRNIPDASVAPLVAHEIPWLEQDWPVDWNGMFGRQAPKALEIGFGDGMFLLELARRRPEIDHVGMEISFGRIRILCERAAYGALANLRVLDGDAHALLEFLVPAGTFAEVFINFPDPWHKTRHHEKRLVNHEFLELLSSRMCAGGLLEIATDHAELATWIRGVLEGQRAFTPIGPEPVIHHVPGRAPTKYERRALEAGATIHYFHWSNERCVASSPRTEAYPAMPTIRLHGAADIAAAMDAFEPLVRREQPRDDELVICFQRVLRQANAPAWLVEAVVHEGRLTQSLAIAVVAHDDGNVVVLPSPIGHPRATAGVKRTVWWVAKHLLTSCPTLVLANSDLEADYPLAEKIP